MGKACLLQCVLVTCGSGIAFILTKNAQVGPPLAEQTKKRGSSQNGTRFGRKKEEKAPIGATTYMNLESVMLSQRSQTEKTTYYRIPFIGNI